MQFATYIMPLALLSQISVWAQYITQYNIQNKQANQSEADKMCSRTQSGFLPYSYAYQDYSYFPHFLKRHNVHKSWLGLHKYSFNNKPHWLGSTAVSTNLLPKGGAAASIEECGYLSRFGHINLAKCNQLNKEYGTLCRKECSHCDMVESMCFKYGLHCYLIFCGQPNWFAARQLCRNLDADLAILENNKELIKTVAEFIEMRENPCTNFWVGMSTFSWNGIDRQIIPYWDWGIGEPSADGKCAYIQHMGDNIGWYSADCSEVHEVICSKNVAKPDSSSSSTTSLINKSSNKKDSLINNIDTSSGSEYCCFGVEKYIVITCLICLTTAVLALSILLFYTYFKNNVCQIKHREYTSVSDV